MNRQKRFRFHEDIRKKCVSPTVVDYADTCQTNRWLCRHRVRVVNDYADTVNYLTFKNEKTSDKSNNKLNLILRKCLIFIVLDYTDPLRGHGVGIVVGYLYTNSKLWRFHTDFKGIISQKRDLFKCVYSYNGHNLKTWKYPYLKKISGIHVVVDYAVGWSDFEK